MRALRDKLGKPFSLINLPQSGTRRLIKAAVYTLILHIFLGVFLMPTLKLEVTKDVSSVYKVTIQRFSYSLFFAETQIQKEEPKLTEEIKQSEPIEEPKQPSEHHAEENKLREPIPLPMALTSSSNTDSNIDKEDNFAIPLPPRPEEKYEKTPSELFLVEWSGTGVGGFDEGEGTGSGSPDWINSGKGSAMERGGLGIRGSGKGTGLVRRRSRWGGFENGGDSLPHPRYAGNPKPAYPLEAREKGCEGEVLLRVKILSNGRVGQIEVKKSSGYEILDQSALTTVKRWRFIPARKGVVPIPFWVNIPIKFQLR